MEGHKFRVGQLVVFRHLQQVGASPPARGYKILRLLPREGSDYAYRVKTITEAVDRVAMEGGIELLPSLSTGMAT